MQLRYLLVFCGTLRLSLYYEDFLWGLRLSVQPIKRHQVKKLQMMEIWQRIESSVEQLALEKAVKKVMETAEEGQQDRAQV